MNVSMVANKNNHLFYEFVFLPKVSGKVSFL